MRRIKFYSPNDGSVSKNLERLEQIVDNFDPIKTDFDINEIVEYYNIYLFVKNRVLNSLWASEHVDLLQNNAKEFKNIVIRYFTDNINLIITRDINNLEYYYHSDFWSILVQYNLLNKVSDKQFRQFIINEKPNLRLMLEHKSLVSRYDEIIREYILQVPSHVELILDHYETKRAMTSKIYLPKSLSLGDKETLINEYISLDNANLNYLRMIRYIQDSKDSIVLKPKTRLKAKKRIMALEKELLSGSNSLSISFSISKQEQNTLKKFDDLNPFNISYSKQWLDNKTDKATLLNNFIILFEYLDSQFRIDLISKYSDIGVIERENILCNKNAYPNSIIFNMYQDFSNYQMHFYEEHLKSIGTCVEDLIEWYFHDNINEVYGVDNYSFVKKSSKTTFYERCILLVTEMEKILKQYDLLVEDGKIDHDLLEIKSEQLIFKNCKSFITDKYIYEQNNEFIDNLFYLLFSDQCMLAYVERVKTNYECFYDLILHESVSMNDFSEYKHCGLNWLVNSSIIVEEDDKIAFKSMEQVFIFHELYVYRVVNYYRVSPNIQKEIDLLLAKGLLISESSLFSRPEQDYFNYHLNKSTFNNSLDIRNSYLHGTGPQKDKVREHQNNYYTILKLFILVIFKIDDDLSINKNTNNIK